MKLYFSIALSLLLFLPVWSAGADKDDGLSEEIQQRIEELREGFSRDRALDALQSIGKPALPQLLKALKGGDSTLQLWSMEALGFLGGKGAVEAIIPFLKHRECHVRFFAARALGRIGTPDVIAPLSKAAQDPDRTVRTTAAISLGWTHNEKALPALVKLLDDKEYVVKLSACRALELISGLEYGEDIPRWKAWYVGEKRTHLGEQVQFFIIRLRNPRHRKEAARCLVEMGRAALPALELMMGRRRFEDQSDAAYVLVEMAKNQDLDTDLRRDVVNALARKLSHRNWTIRRRIEDSLLSVGPSVVPLLIERLRTADNSMCLTLTHFLARFGADAVPGLVKEAAEGNPRYGIAVARALARIGRPAVQPLIDARIQELHMSQVYLDEALAGLGVLALVPILERGRQWEVPVRAALGRILGGFPRSIISDLLPYLAHRDARVREMAALAFTRLETSRCVDALARLLKDPDPRVRCHAAAALANQGDRRGVPRLLELVDLFHRDGRAEHLHLLSTLEKIPDSRVAPRILPLLWQPSYPARIMAFRILAASNDSRAVEPMIRYLSNPGRLHGGEMVKALASTGDPRALGILEAYFQDPSRPESRIKKIWACAGILRIRHNPKALRYLSGLLRKSSLQLKAAEALGMSQNPEALPLLTEAINREKGKLQFALGRALGRLGPRAKGVILESVTRKPLHKTYWAVGALETLGRTHPEHVREMIHLSDPRVREAAIRALARLNDEEMVPRLMALLRHCPGGTRSAVFFALGRIADPRALPALAEGFQRESRKKSLPLGHELKNAFLGLGTPAVPFLCEICDQGGRSSRFWAVQALAGMGDKRAVPYLIGVLKEGPAKPQWNSTEDFALRGLRRITGRSFPASYAAWMKWWEKQGR